MSERLARAARGAIVCLERLGRAHLFALSLLGALGAALRRLPATLVELARVVARGLPSAALGGLLVGIILALYLPQGPASAAGPGLGEVVATALLREIAPVVAALLFAARAGSAWAAEIGRMRVGEQLAALEMMGLDPLRRVLAPRFLAGIMAMPLLAALFCALAVIGAYLVGIELPGGDAGAYRAQVRAVIIDGDAAAEGLVKSVVFGALVAWIALFQGSDGPAARDDVPRATMRAAVHASLAVLAANVLLSALRLAG